MSDLGENIRSCRLCAERFAATKTAHNPRPIVWFHPSARILIAGQAPGARVHASGRPFTDPSGDRLRDWLGLTEDEFYDQRHVAIVPMSFCFPGYDASGSDFPPPKICAQTWHEEVMESLADVRLTVLVGGYAHQHHLGKKMSVTARVQSWAEHAPKVFPLPHPSWRNTGWIKRNPWFTQALLPELRARVTEVMNG